MDYHVFVRLGQFSIIQFSLFFLNNKKDPTQRKFPLH